MVTISDFAIAQASTSTPGKKPRQNEGHVRDGDDHHQEHQANAQGDVSFGGLHLLDQERRPRDGRQNDQSDLQRLVKRQQLRDAVGEQRHQHEIGHQCQYHQPDVLERPCDLTYGETQPGRPACYRPRTTGRTMLRRREQISAVISPLPPAEAQEPIAAPDRCRRSTVTWSSSSRSSCACRGRHCPDRRPCHLQNRR